MPCFSTIQWLASDTNGLTMAAPIFRVIPRTEHVADVVQQRAHHVLLVLTAFVGERRSQQRVLQSIDGVAAGVAAQQLQMRKDAVGQLAGKRHVVGGDDVPVLLGALAHGLEGRALLEQHVPHSILP